MERERRRGQAEGPGDRTGREPGLTGPHQQAEHVEAALLGQGAEPSHGVALADNISKFIEV